jgi:hypothetical protein
MSKYSDIRAERTLKNVVAHYSAEDFYSKMMPASGVYEKENVK